MRADELLSQLDDTVGLLPGVPYMNARVLISGPPKCGRTTWVSELAVALATGTALFDLRGLGAAAPTLLVSAEPRLARHVRAAHSYRYAHDLELLRVEPYLLASDQSIARVVRATQEHEALNVIIDDADVPLQLGYDVAPLLVQLHRPRVNVYLTAREARETLYAWAEQTIVIEPYSETLEMPWQLRIDDAPYVRYRMGPHPLDGSVGRPILWPPIDLTEMERTVFRAVQYEPCTLARLQDRLAIRAYVLMNVLRTLYEYGIVACIRRPPRKGTQHAPQDHEKWWSSFPVPHTPSVYAGTRSLIDRYGTTGGRTPWRDLWSDSEVRFWARFERYQATGRWGGAKT